MCLVEKEGQMFNKLEFPYDSFWIVSKVGKMNTSFRVIVFNASQRLISPLWIKYIVLH